MLATLARGHLSTRRPKICICPILFDILLNVLIYQDIVTVHSIWNNQYKSQNIILHTFLPIHICVYTATGEKKACVPAVCWLQLCSQYWPHVCLQTMSRSAPSPQLFHHRPSLRRLGTRTHLDKAAIHTHTHTHTHRHRHTHTDKNRHT